MDDVDKWYAEVLSKLEWIINTMKNSVKRGMFVTDLTIDNIPHKIILEWKAIYNG